MDRDTKKMLQWVRQYTNEAQQCQVDGHILEAHQLIESCVTILRLITTTESNQEMRAMYNKYLDVYKDQVQALRDEVSEHMHCSHILDRITIPEGARGFTYQNLFGQYLDDTVISVHIYEPQLLYRWQLKNLTNYIKMLVSNCPKLLYVRLLTRRPPSNRKIQMRALEKVRKTLDDLKVTFRYQFDLTQEESLIIMNNGLIIKCSLGVHIYKPSWISLGLGLSIFGLRRCRAATVEIFKTQPFRQHITK